MPRPAEPIPPLTRGTVWLLAVSGCAVTVANLYYAQPLLPAIARDLGAPEERLDFVSAVTRVGYSLGLLLVVPLGDVLEGRRLILALMGPGPAGLAGALAAPLGGRVADRRVPRLLLGVGLTLVLASWGLLAVAGRRLAGLVAGVVLLDFAAQSAHIPNQSRIYRLPAALRNRLNSACMVSFFPGASARAGRGWAGVCAVGNACALAAFALTAPRVAAPAPAPPAPP